MFLWLKPGAQQAFFLTLTVCLVLPRVLPGSVHTSQQVGQDCLTSLEDDSGYPKGMGLTQATDFAGAAADTQLKPRPPDST